MVYKAENIDTDKFIEQLEWLEDFDRTKENKEKIAVEKYHEGYREALIQVKDMFYCSNYEKKEKKSNANITNKKQMV